MRRSRKSSVPVMWGCLQSSRGGGRGGLLAFFFFSFFFLSAEMLPGLSFKLPGCCLHSCVSWVTGPIHAQQRRLHVFRLFYFIFYFFCFVFWKNLNWCLTFALNSTQHLFGFINLPEALVREEAGRLIQYTYFLSASVSGGLSLNLGVKALAFSDTCSPAFLLAQHKHLGLGLSHEHWAIITSVGIRCV